MIKENKWINGAIPALFIHSCIGSVYCWSLLKGDISQAIGCSVGSIEFAFSLAIFFLGMSAAFGGRFVERNVKKASLLSTFCFITGLLGTILAIQLGSIPLLFLFYGAIMGIGLGIGYLSPVKTLMLWFKEHKGLATGIAISGFGLSKVLFSPLIEWCNQAYGVQMTLLLMAGISAIFMSIATWVIKKPNGWIEKQSPFSLKESWHIITNSTYLRIWFIFYLNITCGLALISFEKTLALGVGITWIAILSSLTAAFNTLGRFGYSTCSDYLHRKIWIYVIIFLTSLLVCIGGTSLSVIGTVLLLCIVNLGYGGGFSTLPTLLQSRFGMEKISTIHGFALSAWAWAGLSGNQLSSFVLERWDTTILLCILSGLYGLALITSMSLLKK